MVIILKSSCWGFFFLSYQVLKYTYGDNLKVEFFLSYQLLKYTYGDNLEVELLFFFIVSIVEIYIW